MLYCALLLLLPLARCCTCLLIQISQATVFLIVFILFLLVFVIIILWYLHHSTYCCRDIRMVTEILSIILLVIVVIVTYHREILYYTLRSSSFSFSSTYMYSFRWSCSCFVLLISDPRNNKNNNSAVVNADPFNSHAATRLFVSLIQTGFPPYLLNSTVQTVTFLYSLGGGIVLSSIVVKCRMVLLISSRLFF